VDRAPQPGLRILVVDDEESLRRMTGEMLIDAGYEVCSGKDGVEALQLYRQHWGEIHMVILDMVMPRLGGLETFRRIRGMDRKARILLYSGYDRNEQALQAIREGALGLLAKPFGKSELLQWVRKVLPEN
jgi:CheY-like chemotaxis protein